MTDRDHRWEYLTDGARVFDLSHALEPTMPVSPNHPGYRMALLRRHGDMVRPDGGSASNELIVLGGHTGTHIDALAHVSHRGRLHGDRDAELLQRGGRFAELGVETIAPIVTRGVLLDVARLHGVDVLPPAHAIGAKDLEAAAIAQGVRPAPGAAIVIRSGWGQWWTDPPRYLGHDSGVPGVDLSGAAWLADRQPRVVAHDSMAFEHLPPSAGHRLLPVHGRLLVEHGIHIIENANLEELAAAQISEFAFICLPLRFVGATGSPVRPVALA